MIKKLEKSALVAIILSSATACSSPTDANKDNFKAAINDYYELKRECVDIGKLPVTTSESKNPTVLDEFEKLGFLKAEKTKIKNESLEALLLGEGPKQVSALKYTLTPEGESVASINSGDKVSFCYARNEVEDVIDFTKPTESEGYVISRVSYTYKLGDIADWAKNSEILQEKNLRLRQAINKSDEAVSGSAVLVQMSDKWKHGNLVR
ncbi:hypothetical protein [Methylophaga pinxianii]|uniref:hypothetical protein n=1 Tax=Methylophaga pinxianii TaxID=2881052 RepID=UPI001CF58B96|nr:hypothetical protein [Methylophaga pinxianii]MCB2425775.1 hypothetical protein [Methylophaga pinxianii]UPH46378.1 hypothetical protein LGT42_003610 [Methylophaga pinxianii]